MELIGHRAESVVDDIGASFAARAKHWLRCEAPWFLASLTGHVVVLLALLLILGKVVAEKKPVEDAAVFEEVSVEPAPAASLVEHIVIDNTPPNILPINIDDPPPTDTGNDVPFATEFTSGTGGGDTLGESPRGLPRNALDGNTTFSVSSIGFAPALKVARGNGPSDGPTTSTSGPNRNDPGRGFGMTPQSEHAVAGALYWLVRHQLSDGSWSLRDFDNRCTDKTCTGQGEAETDAGATALGVLPLLASGQTSTAGPYKTNVQRALYWLISHQNGKDGDLAGGAKGNAHMYAHALATIALCEAYSLSPRDKDTGRAAQRAIDFIVAAQNAGTGGWRYEPGQDGDTSVVAWQVMALKSAQMAYLNVPKSAFDGAEKWLKSCGQGNYGEQFSYQPGGGATPAMSAAGLLCSQYLHLRRDDPQLRGGVDYLLRHLPNTAERDTYYWYYATQVMHNLAGPEWDDWNRAIRKLLIETQAREGCAAGSWDPVKPALDRWGQAGGRLMVTSLSCLTLEVYYRHLPLFKLDNRDELKAGAK